MPFYRPYHMRRRSVVSYTHPVATVAIVTAGLLFGITMFFAAATLLLMTVRT